MGEPVSIPTSPSVCKASLGKGRQGEMSSVCDLGLVGWFLFGWVFGVLGKFGGLVWVWVRVWPLSPICRFSLEFLAF